MGKNPLFLEPMSIKRSILDSSIVDLVPRRTAHSSWISGSSCCCKAINPSSVLARAGASLPVVGLIFSGIGIFKSVSSSQNCLLEANYFLTASLVSHSRRAIRPSSIKAFSSRTSCRRSINSASSTLNCGWINILKVISIN